MLRRARFNYRTAPLQRLGFGMEMIRSHRDLRVFHGAVDAAIKTLGFLPRLSKEENWTLGQQVRRCAPSVCANIAEAWRKRRYKKHFISKLTDAEAEAAETQVWLELMWKQGRITEAEFTDTFADYEKVIGQIISFQNKADKFAVFPD